MHKSIARRFMFGILLLSCLGVRSFGLNVEGGKEELLRTLVANNEASRMRFTNYTMEQEWRIQMPRDEEPVPDGPQEAWGGQLTMKVTQKGDYYRLTRTEKLSTVSGNWKEDRHFEAVYGPDYYAEYMTIPMNLVSLWDNVSPGVRQDQAERMESWLRKPSAIDYLFGDGRSTLKRKLEKGRPDNTWTVEETQLNNEPVYLITVSFPAKDGIRKGMTEIYLDAKKDFLVRGMRQIKVDGSLVLSTDVDLQYLESSGRWVPSTVHLKRSEGSGTELWMTVKSMELNPPMEDSLFTFDSIEVLPEARMTRYAKHGTVIKFRFLDGEWAPK